MKVFFPSLRFLIIILLFLFATNLAAQEEKGTYKKGSYLYYGQPNIEDNSMFIEEAFNQEKAIIQHISNFIWDDLNGGNFLYGYTQEIPMMGDKFQFSFTLNYPVMSSASLLDRKGGFGDMLLNFRPMLMDKSDWAIVIPRFTLIVPTGDAKTGFGDGAWGTQFNLAVTKRLNRKLTTHWNAGFTNLFNRDFYGDVGSGTQLLEERNTNSYNLGLSGIYIVNNSINLMVEYVSSFDNELVGVGQKENVSSSIINPGFRCAFSIGKVQIVPGLGVPLYFTDNKFQNTGGFIYLSIEPDYTK